MDRLYNILRAYADSNAMRFHTPGHSGANLDITTDMDITELSFSDNMLEPKGIIANLEASIAPIYNASHCLILTAGATVGIAMALHTARQFGKRLTIIGDAHKSVYNYAYIFGYDIINVSCFDDISNDFTDVVVVTSPDYFGNITKIPSSTRDYILIVDGSHGAHFPFSDALPNLDAAQCDILVTSFHKTLPVLTGGAAVLCSSDKIYSSLYRSRSILHSSSPSYLTMASIDRTFDKFYSDSKSMYDKVLDKVEEFRHLLSDRYSVVANDDKTRLVISTNGQSGAKTAAILEKWNIYIEMTYEDNLVLIVTPYNYMHLPIVANALNNINCTDVCVKVPHFNLKQTKYDSKNIILQDIMDCEGKVSAANIGVYPPGIPIIKCGDIITSEVVSWLAHTEYSIFGLTDGKIAIAEAKI